MKRDLPMHLSGGQMSTTTKVWDVLVASRDGDVERFRRLTAENPALEYAQYNYTPPIHFAVREGHIELVRHLLERGAFDPEYKTYPFQDTLLAFATDRGFNEIAEMLRSYLSDADRHFYKGDNGEIDYRRNPLEASFEQAVDGGDVAVVAGMLETTPLLIHNETYNWGEGILLFPAKSGNWEMIDLLMRYGATVPKVTKWCRFYYFERTDSAAYLLKRGMDPNHMSWHRVTLLHDMAHSGDLEKAELLISHGADINAVEEEYLSTPLGFAVRCGNVEMVQLLIEHGADVKKSGAPWSTPMAWARARGHDEIVEILLYST